MYAVLVRFLFYDLKVFWYEMDGGCRGLRGGKATTDEPHVRKSNSKHMDVRHHILKKILFRREISIAHLASEEQHVDFLTKSLTDTAFCFHGDLYIRI